MFKRFFNFLFGKKEVPTVSVELNAIEVSTTETVKPIEDIYFPVTALAEATPVITEKPKKARKPRKPKAAPIEAVSTDAETAEVKPKKRRYYKPRKKKTDNGSASSPEKSL